MKRLPVMHRIGATSGSALLGGGCGILLIALGSTISGTPLGVGATVVLAIVLGAGVGQLTGAILGGICGVLLVALGTVVGGSTLGVVLTIVFCALIGGLLVEVSHARSALPGAIPRPVSAHLGTAG